jgi:Argonaute linker 1 domain
MLWLFPPKMVEHRPKVSPAQYGKVQNSKKPWDPITPHLFSTVCTPNSRFTYTGRSVAWSTERIHNIPTIEIPRGKSSIKVTFNYATEFALADLSAYVKRQKENSPETSQCLTFLNQVIANSFTKESSRFMAVGRKYFPLDDDERDISSVDDWSLLEFRKGFYQAVHWGGTAGLTVNVNVTTGIFWNSQLHTIGELALRTIGKAATDGMALSTLNDNQFRMIARNVRGIKFCGGLFPGYV